MKQEEAGREKSRGGRRREVMAVEEVFVLLEKHRDESLV